MGAFIELRHVDGDVAFSLAYIQRSHPALAGKIPAGAFAHGDIDLAAFCNFIRKYGAVEILFIFCGFPVAGIAVVIGAAVPDAALTQIDIQCAAVRGQYVSLDIKSVFCGSVLCNIYITAIAGDDVAVNGAAIIVWMKFIIYFDRCTAAIGKIYLTAIFIGDLVDFFLAVLGTSVCYFFTACGDGDAAAVRRITVLVKILCIAGPDNGRSCDINLSAPLRPDGTFTARIFRLVLGFFGRFKLRIVGLNIVDAAFAGRNGDLPFILRIEGRHDLFAVADLISAAMGSGINIVAAAAFFCYIFCGIGFYSNVSALIFGVDNAVQFIVAV